MIERSFAMTLSEVGQIQELDAARCRFRCNVCLDRQLPLEFCPNLAQESKCRPVPSISAVEACQSCIGMIFIGVEARCCACQISPSPLLLSRGYCYKSRLALAKAGVFFFSGLLTSLHSCESKITLTRPSSMSQSYPS